MIAVIPARGGSKRIPAKNRRPFLGEPLIQRTIRTVAASGIFERIVVSTDDDQIAELAGDAGAEVPFMRPPTLADDHTGTAPVVLHAIEQIEAASGGSIPSICAVYATAALMRPEDLASAARRFEPGGVDLLFAAAPHPAPIERSWVLGAEGDAEMRWPDQRLTRSQDLPVSFYDVGWFYFGSRRYWDDPDGSPMAVRLFEVDRLRAVDIDTEADWTVAETLAGRLQRDSPRTPTT